MQKNVDIGTNKLTKIVRLSVLLFGTFSGTTCSVVFFPGAFDCSDAGKESNWMIEFFQVWDFVRNTGKREHLVVLAKVRSKIS